MRDLCTSYTDFVSGSYSGFVRGRVKTYRNVDYHSHKEDHHEAQTAVYPFVSPVNFTSTYSALILPQYRAG